MNLILECDTAKGLNHHFVRAVEGNQFYVRAKHDTHFVGLRAMILKYFSQPITYDDLEEARGVYEKRGELDSFCAQRWIDIIEDCDGYLPITIRALPEGTKVTSGEPMMVIETRDEKYSWVPYAIDSIVLRSIWFPSSLATRLSSIKEEVTKWVDDPMFVYDIANRAAVTDEAGDVAASIAKMVFNYYDSIGGSSYLEKYYGFVPDKLTKTFLVEHNHIIAWESERDFIAYASKLPDDAVVVFLVDTYDVEACIDFVISHEMQDLIRSKQISLYVLPDSLRAIEELKEIHLKLKKTNVGIVLSGLNFLNARNLRKVSDITHNMMFMLEDDVLQHNLSRNLYGFEYKQCAIKPTKESCWYGVAKQPSHCLELHTLSGYQIIHDAKTVFIYGHVFHLDTYADITARFSHHVK